MEETDKKHNLIKNDPSLIMPELKEALPMVRAIALTMPGFDPAKISDNHLALAYAFVNIGDIVAAAAASGFTSERAKMILSGGILVTLVQFLAKNHLHSVGYVVGARALIDIMADPGASPAARVGAVKAMRDWVESDGKQQADGKPLAEMTVEELASLIHKLEGAAQLEQKTIDAKPSITTT